MVTAQIALLSRLRSLYSSCNGDSVVLSERIDRAGGRLRSIGEKWDYQPEGWTPHSDTLLIHRLVHGGLTDKIVIHGNASGSSFELTRGSTHQRANQLVRELHAAEENVNATSRVLEERRNAPWHASKVPGADAASKPQRHHEEPLPSQNMTEHRVVGTDVDSSSKPQQLHELWSPQNMIKHRVANVFDPSCVIDLAGTSEEDMSDDDVDKILGKVPTAEKRKSNDSTDNSSDKKLQ